MKNLQRWKKATFEESSKVEKATFEESSKVEFTKHRTALNYVQTTFEDFSKRRKTHFNTNLCLNHYISLYSKVEKATFEDSSQVEFLKPRTALNDFQRWTNKHL